MTIVKVVIWEPTGWGASSMGHISVVVVDGGTATSYSLAPGGCDVRPFDEYMSKNSFRTGYILELNLSAAQSRAVGAYFQNYFNNAASPNVCGYQLIGTAKGINNCATPIQRALQSAGVNWETISALPRGVGLSLWNKGRVRRASKCSGYNQVRIFVPPWSNTTKGAYPWENRANESCR